MSRSFAFLFGAVLFEVSWAVLLKLSRGFTVFWPSAGMVVAYVLSLVFLNAACRALDVSVAYAIWTGSGATIVALIGVSLFREPCGPGRLVGFVLVIAGVTVLIGLEGQGHGDAPVRQGKEAVAPPEHG